MHILPKGFVRIRHYGFLSSTSKRVYLKELQNQPGKPVKVKPKQSLHLFCPKYKQGMLETMAVFDARGPPKHWLEKIRDQNLRREKSKVMA